MLMPKRYKEWNSGGCVTTVQNVWVTLSSDSLAIAYNPNPPKWYVVSLDNKIFNAEFSKADAYGQPLPEGEDSTITILKMLYAGDGACASITDDIEASTTYSARLNITDLNREGSVEVDVVQIVDGGAVERLLSSQTVTSTGIMDIDFTTETEDSVRVKIVLTEDMGDRDTAYVSLKLDKFSHPITLTHYYQALQPRLVTTCGEVKDLYRFGHNGQMKTNELAGIGNWYTALYWEYGSREAGRKNPDPVRNPSISPYSVFSGNPILLGDPNGDKVNFKGWSKEEVSPLSPSEAKSMWNDIVDFLHKNGVDAEYNALVKSATTYDLIFTAGAKRFAPNIDNRGNFTIENPTIFFNPYTGLKTNKYYVLSPVEGLIHELGHAAGFDENPCEHLLRSKPDGSRYDNKEEERVITGLEQRTAMKIGENYNGMTRTDHGGTSVPFKNWRPLWDKSNELKKDNGNSKKSENKNQVIIREGMGSMSTYKK